MDNTIFTTNFSVKDTTQVKLLQDTLKRLGYLTSIPEDEKNGSFGAITKAAVKAFNTEQGLAAVSTVSEQTIATLNTELVNQRTFCVKGRISDNYHTAIKNINITIKLINGSEIGIGTSLSDGSYCVFLNIDPSLIGFNGLLKNKLGIIVTCTQGAQSIQSDTIYIDGIETIVNFLSTKFICQESTRYSHLKGKLTGLTLDTLKPEEFSQEALKRNVSTDDLMKMVLSSLLSKKEKDFTKKDAILTDEKYFGYLSQNMPANIPATLFSDNVWKDILGLWNNEKNNWSSWFEEWKAWFEEWKIQSNEPTPIKWNTWKLQWDTWKAKWNEWEEKSQLAFKWGGWEKEWTDKQWIEWNTRKSEWNDCLKEWDSFKRSWETNSSTINWISIWEPKKIQMNQYLLKWKEWTTGINSDFANEAWNSIMSERIGWMELKDERNCWWDEFEAWIEECRWLANIWDGTIYYDDARAWYEKYSNLWDKWNKQWDEWNSQWERWQAWFQIAKMWMNNVDEAWINKQLTGWEYCKDIMNSWRTEWELFKDEWWAGKCPYPTGNFSEVWNKYYYYGYSSAWQYYFETLSFWNTNKNDEEHQRSEWRAWNIEWDEQWKIKFSPYENWMKLRDLRNQWWMGFNSWIAECNWLKDTWNDMDASHYAKWYFKFSRQWEQWDIQWNQWNEEWTRWNEFFTQAQQLTNRDFNWWEDRRREWEECRSIMEVWSQEWQTFQSLWEQGGSNMPYNNFNYLWEQYLYNYDWNGKILILNSYNDTNSEWAMWTAEGDNTFIIDFDEYNGWSALKTNRNRWYNEFAAWWNECLQLIEEINNGRQVTQEEWEEYYIRFNKGWDNWNNRWDNWILHWNKWAKWVRTAAGWTDKDQSWIDDQLAVLENNREIWGKWRLQWEAFKYAWAEGTQCGAYTNFYNLWCDYYYNDHDGSGYGTWQNYAASLFSQNNESSEWGFWNERWDNWCNMQYRNWDTLSKIKPEWLNWYKNWKLFWDSWSTYNSLPTQVVVDSWKSQWSQFNILWNTLKDYVIESSYFEHWNGGWSWESWHNCVNDWMNAKNVWDAFIQAWENAKKLNTWPTIWNIDKWKSRNSSWVSWNSGWFSSAKKPWLYDVKNAPTEDYWLRYKNSLVDDIFGSIVLLDEVTHIRILESAVKLNYIAADSNIAGLAKNILGLRSKYAYNNPILQGRVSLSSLLQSCTWEGNTFTEVKRQDLSDLFVTRYNDFNRFISDLKSDEKRTLYGEKNAAQLINVFEISRVVRNHIPVISIFLNNSNIKSPSAIAALSYGELNTTIGDNKPSDIENYVDLVYNNAKQIYPFVSMSAKIAKALEHDDTEYANLNVIKNFLINTPQFDLLKDDPFKAPLTSEQKNTLFSMQRVTRMAVSPDIGAAMYANKIRSARQVYFMGKSTFETKVRENNESDLTQTEIDASYNLATSYYANMMVAYATVNRAFRQADPSVVSAGSDTEVINALKQDFPDIETLFGNTDYCECDYENSVYSAPAYLADLLTFLDARKVLELLVARRSDLSQIYLNKQNTDTILPYIDLVCEVLEEATLKTRHPEFIRSVSTCQSTLTSQELYAAPEHILKKEIKNGESISIKTAYNEIIPNSIYPMHISLELPRLEMRAYLEKMGIQRHILMQTFLTKSSDKIKTACEYFELTDVDKSVIVAEAPFNNVADRNEAWTKNFGGTGSKSMKVPDFLKSSGLSLLELIDLTKTSWLSIICSDIQTQCNYADKDVIGSAEQFDKAHRFIRLWRKSSWKIWELDRLLCNAQITPNGNRNLDNDALINLMEFKKVQNELHLSCEDLLTFYEDICITDVYENGKKKACLYDRIFLRTVLSNPLNDRLVSIKDIKGHPNAKLLEEDHKLVMACLSVNENDYAILKGQHSLYDRNYLSYLYRHVLLAQSTEISIGELFTLFKLHPNLPLFSSGLPAALAWIELIKSIKATKYKLSEYEYLLNYSYKYNEGISDKALSIALSQNQIEHYAKEILNSAFSEENPLSDNDRKIAITNKLSLLFGLSGSLIKLYLDDSMLNILMDKQNYTSEPADNLCKTFVLLHKFVFVVTKNNIAVEDVEFLLQNQAKIKFNWREFRKDSDTGTVTLESLLELSNLLDLQEAYNKTPEGETLFTLIGTLSTQTYESFKQKLCLLSTGWNLPDLQTIASSGYLNLSDITNFYESKTYKQINQYFSLSTISGISIAALNNWKSREISNGMDENIRSVEAKEALKSRYDIDTWLKVLAEIQKPVREVKSHALASFLIETSRREPAKTQGFTWNDKTALYGHFLLDTEMSACMKTSRIVQATSSIQLFVQRCLLNLENVVVDETADKEWKQWDWMQKYRLWEANRKIFLYPENWIEPELRDNKTPFFKELEDELNQSEVTSENVETVFENYLQKLDEVSNLAVCGIYREWIGKNDGTGSLKDCMHVIGRSHSTPFQFYYRNYDALALRWSHWEKIDLDLRGDMVIPVVYNRKLHLFWLSTVEKTKNNNTEENINQAQAASDYTEVQLGWSVYKKGKWSKIKYSGKKHIQEGHYTADKFTFTSQYNSTENELTFNIYSLMPNSDSASNRYGTFYFNGNVYYAASYIQNVSNSNMVLPELVKSMNSSDSPNIEKVGNLEKYESEFSNLFAGRLYTQRSAFDFSLLRTYPGNNVNYDVNKGMSFEQTDAVYKPFGLEVFVPNLYYTNAMGYSTRQLLVSKKRNPNLVMMLHDFGALNTGMFESHLKVPFFYQDSDRSFFVVPRNWNSIKNLSEYDFQPFYHPYTKLFIKELNHKGINGLLNRNIQISPQEYDTQNKYDFNKEYHPMDWVHIANNYKTDIVDFNLSGAYADYNWELFFHTPLYIACKLSQNQKFEEAMQWFHYIFNPANKAQGIIPQKFWITKPFFEISTSENRAEQIRNVLKNMAEHTAAINEWLNNPYKPHLVARNRPTAYQKAVVMRYIDNLIAWADQLFRQDSMESTNQAMLLYILAYQILGQRPVEIPREQKEIEHHKNFETIKEQLEKNFKKGIGLEETFEKTLYYAFSKLEKESNITIPELSKGRESDNKSSSQTLPNFILEDNPVKLVDKPLQWNVIDFATLSSGNIFYEKKNFLPASLTEVSTQSGIVTEFKELQPAVNRKTMVGDHEVYLPTIKQAEAEPLPRFIVDPFCIPANDKLLSYWNIVEDRLFKLRHCMNIEGVVRELPLFEPPIDPALLVKASAAGISIGDAVSGLNQEMSHYRFRVILQKALEFTGEVKQLGEKLLSAIEKRDVESLNMLRNTQEINLQQAVKQIRKLQINEAQQNIQNLESTIHTTEERKAYYESREYMNALEITSMGLSIGAGVIEATVSIMRSMSGVLELTPDYTVGGSGFGGSPVATASHGGQKISGSMDKNADAIAIIGHALDRTSSLLSVQAGYKRRKEDWDFQAKMADMELQQLNKQITAAEIRKMMAEKELENFEMQMEQSQSVLEYYKYKYTNEELYNWMITQISGMYFKTYELALNLAKQAEKCFQNELNLTNTYIETTYWDSLRKGLLSGDRLTLDLRRMEAEYYRKNERTLELTKHISLAQMYPANLIQLITEKKTELPLEELIFDMDYPGHYMRRIKSVSVTIPNVSGPYTTISFTLRLSNSKIRKNTDSNLSIVPFKGTNVICTSSAQNDSGMFELNFGDERYLPFENAGVISNWELSFPSACNQFDLSTVSDVILHINYIALDGGITFANQVKTEIKDKLPKAGAILFSPKLDFPDAWNKMSVDNNTVSFILKPEHFPFFLRENNSMILKHISVVLSSSSNDKNISINTKKGSDPINSVSLTKQLEENGNMALYHTPKENLAIINKVIKVNEEWSIQITGIAPSEVNDILIGFILGQ